MTLREESLVWVYFWVGASFIFVLLKVLISINWSVIRITASKWFKNKL